MKAKIELLNGSWWVELEAPGGRQRYCCWSEEQARQLLQRLEKPAKATPRSRAPVSDGKRSGLIDRVSRAFRRDAGHR
jgi:hypothetical protein